jgi:hypothetical protein
VNASSSDARPSNTSGPRTRPSAPGSRPTRTTALSVLAEDCSGDDPPSPRQMPGHSLTTRQPVLDHWSTPQHPRLRMSPPPSRPCSGPTPIGRWRPHVRRCVRGRARGCLACCPPARTRGSTPVPLHQRAPSRVTSAVRCGCRLPGAAAGRPGGAASAPQRAHKRPQRAAQPPRHSPSPPAWEGPAAGRLRGPRAPTAPPTRPPLLPG